MLGDQNDFVRRLRAVLPSRWFGPATPVLDTLLGALATGWSQAFDLLGFTRLQSRIGSASNAWLDLTAYDFFGDRVVRRDGQTDNAFRPIVLRNILRPLATRSALISALQDLTGRRPIVFEPCNTSDTGGYGNIGTSAGGGVGYGVAGGWGNLGLPFQCFVTVFRPHINGAASLAGWSLSLSGYGTGDLAYLGVDGANGYIPDSAILAEVARVAPAGTVVWTNISN
jgi:hypothetical protein